MGKLAVVKTKETTSRVADFINKVKDEQKQKDSFLLLKLMEKVSMEKPKMWSRSLNCILGGRSDMGSHPSVGVANKGTGTGLTANSDVVIRNNKIINCLEEGINLNSAGNNG